MFVVIAVEYDVSHVEAVGTDRSYGLACAIAECRVRVLEKMGYHVHYQYGGRNQIEEKSLQREWVLWDQQGKNKRTITIHKV